MFRKKILLKCIPNTFSGDDEKIDKLEKEIKELKTTIDFYKKEIAKDKQTIKQLQDSLQLERFAREKYLMKKDNEDVYIIEFDSVKK